MRFCYFLLDAKIRIGPDYQADIPDFLERPGK